MAGISGLFGALLYWIYGLVGDYGIALVIFTVLFKLALFPLSMKQIKSTTRMQELQPEMKALQKKYENDKEKLNEEMVKFFKEKNHNPASGCINILVQMPIILVIFQVFRHPISHMLNGAQYLDKILSVEGLKGVVNLRRAPEAEVIFKYSEDIAKRAIGEGVPQWLSDKILDLQEGMRFLGTFDLARVPQYRPETIMSEPNVYIPLLIMVLALVVVTFLSTKLMTGLKNKGKSDEMLAQDDSVAKTNKTMMYFSPLLIGLFSFQLPAGLTLYWMTGTIFQLFQQYYIEHKKEKEKEKEDGAVGNVDNVDDEIDLAKAYKNQKNIEPIAVENGNDNDNKKNRNKNKNKKGKKKKKK